MQVALRDLVPNATDAPVACPCIRYLPEDGKFYVFGAGKFGAAATAGTDAVASESASQSVVLVRSADLASWEPAPRPLLSPDRSIGSPDIRAMNGSGLGLLAFDPSAKYPAGGSVTSNQLPVTSEQRSCHQ